MTADQLTKEFETALPQLKSYILRISANVQDTEDIVQDTFEKFAHNIKKEAEAISNTK
jgi:RNA polymerase sigma-70 factor, ECF subfamily